MAREPHVVRKSGIAVGTEDIAWNALGPVTEHGFADRRLDHTRPMTVNDTLL